MSAPAPPKSVTFEDELSTITMQQHRGQSLAPPSSHLTDRIRRSAIPKTQQADFNYEISSNSGRNPRREIRSPMSRNDFSDGAHFVRCSLFFLTFLKPWRAFQHIIKDQLLITNQYCHPLPLIISYIM